MFKQIISDAQQSDFNKILDQGNKYVLLTHKNPDGDCIGAALAWKNYLQKCGKEASVIVPNEFPDSMQWMPLAESVLQFDKQMEACTAILQSCDTVFMLDFNTPSRMGDELSQLLGQLEVPTVLIDHHPHPNAKCDILISETKVSSTCELVYRVFDKCGLQLDEQVATCLLVGMITDTGGFSHNSSTPDFFSIIGDLLKYGADKDKIYDKIFHTNSESRTRLIGFATSEKMKLHRDNGTSIIGLSAEDLKRFNYQPGDTEGLVNIPLGIKDIEKSILVVEREDIVKLSFRSTGTIAVNAFASKYFGGGGHVNAAGGASKESFTDVMLKLEQHIHEI